jgi:RNA polymerase-binding transcription factor DksA
MTAPGGGALDATGHLAELRRDAERQIADLAGLLGDIINASTSVATDDEHDPEGQTVAFERAQVAALLQAARERLSAIEDAQQRLREGTYGVCVRCGRPIAPDRLAARAAADMCIDCASARRR